MKLNEIELVNYGEQANEVVFVLDGALSDTIALDGVTLTITEGDEVVKVFDGYNMMSAGIENDNHVVARFRRALDDSTAKAINALDANVRVIEANKEDQQCQIDEIAGAIEELAMLIAGDEVASSEEGNEPVAEGGVA